MGKSKPSFLSLVGDVEKAFGRGILMPLNGEGALDVEVVSTGSLALDDQLGIGGVPRGRVVEIYGPEASGKTTLALSIVAQAQKAGGLCAFVDAEHALNMQYVTDIGCDPAHLLISQPECGEQALGVVEHLVRSGQVDVVVVDSVAALIPRAELEGAMEDHAVGTQARLMSKAMRKLIAQTSKTNTTVIFINQVRHKIGVMFGSPETTTGGHALKFYASLRMEVRRAGHLKSGDCIYGQKVKVKIVKNKFAPPFRDVILDLRFGQGFDGPAETLQLAVASGVLTQSGAYYKLGEETYAQGKAKALKLLEDAAECERLQQLVVDARALQSMTVASA